MNHLSENSDCKGNSLKNVGFGLFISIVLVCCFYPDFVLFQSTPMHSSGWELADPIVSSDSFKPSFRVFQYELFTNKNILWSSLRAMGLPILANDIQIAPLFPLTLLLSWMDENVFWNVFVISRIILMSLGSYLLLRKFFNFQKLPTVFFLLSFIYTLYVMRWINHPWQNGLLAGIWYLYFLCLISIQGSGYTFKRFFVFVGLVWSVFSMVTCGFPEAAVMSAVLVILTYIPLIINFTYKKKISWKAYLQDLILAHVIGFALSSYQIFSIIELLSLSESFRYVGSNRYPVADLLPFFAENLTQFRDAGPELFKDSRTFLGLITTTFFLIGFGGSLKNIRRIGFGEVGAILCGVFIVLKLFAIGPLWFNEIFVKLPVLRETYFYVYFFSIFLWFYAFFAAKGFQVFLNSHTVMFPDRLTHLRVWMIITPLLVFLLVCLAAPIATKESLWNLLVVENNYTLIKVLLIYFIAVVAIHVYLSCEEKNLIKNALAISLVVLAIVESSTTLPKNFTTWKTDQNPQLQYLLNQLKEKNIPLTESRIIDRVGTYVSSGLATIDTGAVPLLPLRTKIFRINFFDTLVAGHYPIDRPKNLYSWGITSTNIRSFDRYHGGGEAHFPDWSSMHKLKGGELYFDVLNYNGKKIDKKSTVELSGTRKDYFYLRGWAIGLKAQGLENTAVYIVFKDNDREIVVPTRKIKRVDVARYFGDEKFLNAGWDSYISSSVLKDGTYKIVIRFVDTIQKTYYEKITDSVILFRKSDNTFKPHPFFDYHGQNKNFLGILGQFYIYLDSMAMPRAYSPSKCQAINDINVVLQSFRPTPTFEHGKVFVEKLSEEEKRICTAYKAEVSRVPILKDRGKEVLLEKVIGPTIIVLNDNLYPGWKAIDTVENIPLEIKPTNITFRSVILPEKRKYQILFKYQPEWLLFARLLIIFGICIFVSVFALTVKNKVIQNHQE